ncbi:hypothetical protein [Aeromicrobium sp.]|uniref:hypothetical protein n=1 Tax=Aeromicrobium sp. TaxID=1871063 RepID=UPI002FC62C83
MRAGDLLASLHEQTRLTDKSGMDARQAHALNDASSMALWGTVAAAHFVTSRRCGTDPVFDLETPPLMLVTRAYELINEQIVGMVDIDVLRLLDWVGTIRVVLRR